MNPHIEPKAHLSEFPQISVLVYHVLSVSAAGSGMSERELERTYNETMRGFAEIDGAAFWPFRDELIRILASADGDALTAAGKTGGPRNPYGKN